MLIHLLGALNCATYVGFQLAVFTQVVIQSHRDLMARGLPFDKHTFTQATLHAQGSGQQTQTFEDQSLELMQT